VVFAVIPLLIGIQLLSAAPAEPAFAAPPATAGRSMSRLVRQLILAPDSPVLHYELGMAYHQQRIFPQAEKAFLAARKILRHHPRPGIAESVIVKAYLQTVAAQRSLAADLPLLKELRRLAPSDMEAAGWMAQLHLDRGELSEAQSLIKSFPHLKQNADILAKWVRAKGGVAGGAPSVEERFADLVTLMDVGSAAHRQSAAREIIRLASPEDPSDLPVTLGRPVDRAFDLLTRSDLDQDPVAGLNFYREYLVYARRVKGPKAVKSLLLDMRKKFPAVRLDAPLTYEYAKILASEGQTQESYSALQDAIGHGLDDPAAQVLYAELLDRRGKPLEALRVSVDAFGANLPSADRVVLMEQIETRLRRLGRSDLSTRAADTLFAALMKWMPQSPAVRRAFLDRIEVDPGTATADDLSFAARSAMSENRWPDAEILFQMLRKRRALSEEETRLLDMAESRQRRSGAEAAFASGRFSEALRMYEDLPDSASSPNLLRRAACLARSNRSPDAIRLLEQEQMGLAFQIQRAALLATLYEQTRQPRKAELVYRQIASSDSSAVAADAARKMSDLLARQDRWVEAFGEMDRDASEPGKTAQDRMAWISDRLRRGDMSEPEKMGRVLYALTRDTPAAYLLLGQFEFAMGNRGAAQSAYLTALRVTPTGEAAALGLAALFMSVRQASLAIDVLLPLEPKSKLVCRTIALAYADQDQWEMAAGWMERGEESEEDRMKTAWYWFRAGQINEASRYAPSGGLFQAILAAESGRFDISLEKQDAELLRRIIGEKPESPSPLSDGWTRDVLNSARRRAESGDAESAIGLCDYVINRTQSAEAYYLKGVLHLRLGLYEIGKAALDRARQSPDWRIPANLRLGQLELIISRPAEALGYLDQAGPGSDPAELIMAWGMSLGLSKSPDQGEHILRQVSKKSARGKFFLGRLLELRGKTKEATDVYRNLIRESGEFIPARYRLGLLLLASGDRRGAELSFSTIVEDAEAPVAYVRLAERDLRSLRRHPQD